MVITVGIVVTTCSTAARPIRGEHARRTNTRPPSIFPSQAPHTSASIRSYIINGNLSGPVLHAASGDFYAPAPPVYRSKERAQPRFELETAISLNVTIETRRTVKSIVRD